MKHSILKPATICCFILFIASSFFASAQQLQLQKSGHIAADGIFKLLYVPFEIPEGTTGIEVEEEYDNPAANVLNLGIYDSRGYADGNTAGFRGWSGGAKKKFFICENEASTGYIAGPLSAGVWNVLVYPSKISRDGLNWKLTVTVIKGEHRQVFQVNPAAAEKNTNAGWYRGDLHIHTLHSDGKRTTDELVAEAKEKKLDYIISTEHNTNSANQNWGKYNQEKLLIINGEEVTSTAFGHWNAIGLEPATLIDWRYAPEDNQVEAQVKKVHADGGLAVVNHPFFDFGERTFKYDVNAFDGIEVWNGTWSALNEVALKWWNDLLKQGISKIAIGDSDTHVISGSANNLGRPQSVVYATGLSKKAILEGFRNGRVYLAATDSVRLKMTAAAGGLTAGIGEHLVAAAQTAVREVQMEIEGCAGTSVMLIDDSGIIYKKEITEHQAKVRLKLKNGKRTYVRAEIRKPDGKMVALTNPVWLD